MTQLSRRHLLGLGAGALSAPWLRPAMAVDAGTDAAGTDAHGISVFGDLKYPADFHHFEYVNVAAPKGGLFSLIPSSRAYNQSFFTFNSFNAYILKGEGAQGMDMRRTRRDVRPCGEIRADFPRQAHLPLFDAARGAISRWLETYRA